MNTKLFESIFTAASEARLNENVIADGHAGIEVNLNGWKIANEHFPRPGRPAEFNTRAEALASPLYQTLVQRFGQDRVRVFVQSAA